MPEGLVRKITHHGPARNASAPAMATPVVGFNDAAFDHGTSRLEPLSHRDEAELVETAERREIGRGKGSVDHVEVFRMAV